ncbi:MAG TPA: ABC transporter, partial [Cyclobacteriaceae bacterium]
MNELRYLNKYLRQHKGYLLWGTFFVVVSTIFQIIPAQLVRHSIDLVVENIRVYRSFQGLQLQNSFFNVFVFGILLYAGLILVMALLRGFFLYLVRQTL